MTSVTSNSRRSSLPWSSAGSYTLPGCGNRRRSHDGNRGHYPPPGYPVHGARRSRRPLRLHLLFRGPATPGRAGILGVRGSRGAPDPSRHDRGRTLRALPGGRRIRDPHPQDAGLDRAITAAHAFALGGVLLGMAALAVGAGPSTELNTVYHRVMLVALVAGLVLLL